MMSTTTINKSIFLPASRESVWEYLTDRNKLGEWFHPAAENLVEGKSYTLLADATNSESKMCWGEVLSAKKSSFLSYSFTIKPLAGAMTTVSWSLDEVAGGTRVTLVHEGIGQAAGDAALGLLMALEEGWDRHFVKLRGVAAA